MKIEEPGAPLTPSLKRVDCPAEAAEPTLTPVPASAPAPAPKAGHDAVRLSGDLQLAEVAMRAAAMAGDVRPRAVARAIELFISGNVGVDLDRLADRIIDSLTESSVYEP